jgi:SMC interacting uncharacterized protein involved in chromosome segregation
MSVKPSVISQEAVVEQVKLLQAQKADLEVQLDQLQIKLKNIEASIAENDDLRSKNKTMLEQCFSQFDEEWKRRAEYFPDIRLNVLNAASTLVAPPKK